MTDKTKATISRLPNGTFPKGVSGNPSGRPKGRKNEITILKQELEHALREQAAPQVGKVLDKAIELALEGNPGMIKLLLELHMSKGSSDDKAKVAERVAIQINSAPSAPQKTEVVDVTPIEEDD